MGQGMSLQAMIPYLCGLFGGSFLFVLLVEPMAIALAERFGFIDAPGWRRVHTNQVPRAGGIVFFPCLALGLAAAAGLFPVLWHSRYIGLLGALLLISLCGLWDDRNGIRPRYKFIAQLATGLVLFFSGYRVGDFSIPFTGGAPYELPVLDFITTVLGVAAVINAVNMLDGLDGLAAGSVFIMCIFLFLNKLTVGAADATGALVITAGAALGFLRYNFHPARIFMGDTGSMFLGALLAAEVLDSASQGAAITTIMLPLVILGIPILDMGRTILTRFRVSGNIFAADKSHLHHRLLGLGLSHRETVLFIYGLNVYMGIMAIIYKQVEPATYRGLFLLALGIFLFLASVLIAAGSKNNGSGNGTER